MKKVLILAMMFSLVFSSTALADDTAPDSSPTWDGVIAETMVVEPRFTYIGYVTVGLEIDENGHLIYGGSTCAPYMKVKITVHLQQSTNGLFWDEIATTIKNGYDNIGLEEERDLEEGNYYYRAKVIVDVLDDDRNVLETTTVYSSEEQY